MAEPRQPSWRFRRGIVIWTIGFCSVTVLLALTGWAKEGVEQAAITSAFTLMGFVVATYTGGAVTHDIMTKGPAS